MKSNTPTETAAKIAASQRARWAHVRQLNHTAAALAFRAYVQTPNPDRALAAMLAQRAYETCPADEFPERWARFRDALTGGKTIRSKTFPLTLTAPDDDLAATVNRAFDEVLVDLLAEGDAS